MAGVRFPAWESISFLFLFFLLQNFFFFSQKFHRRIEIKAPDQLKPATNDTLVVENVYTFAATPVQQEMETSQTAHDAELNMQGNAIILPNFDG